MDKSELTTFRVYIAEYTTTLTNKFLNRKKWEKPNPNEIRAVIPGTILDVFVKPKQKVKAGATLLVLEAMKMENQITMPFDGEIKSVEVQKNEIVSKNQLMIELKE